MEQCVEILLFYVIKVMKIGTLENYLFFFVEEWTSVTHLLIYSFTHLVLLDTEELLMEAEAYLR